MKSKNKKIIMIALIVLSVLFLILGSIGFLFKDNSSTPGPNVEKNYQGSFQIVYTATRDNNKVTIGLNKGTNELYEEFDGNRYVIAKDYQIYPTRISYNETPIYIFDKYKVYHEYKMEDYIENNKYFYSYEDGEKSKEYLSISPICLDKDNLKNCEYLILKDFNNNISILNLKDNNIYELDTTKYISITSVDNDNNHTNTNELGYFIVKGINKKYGLIDSTGNELITPIYDSIYALNENLYVVSSNEKTGIVNKNNEILLNIDYYSISSSENYISVYNYDEVTFNYNLDILDYNLKSVLKEKIDNITFTGNQGYNSNYKMYENNKELYLTINSEINYILHINKDGIKEKIEKNYLPLVDQNITKFSPIKYFYERRENNEGDIKLIFYDLDFKQLFVKDYKKEENHRDFEVYYKFYNNLEIFTFKEYYVDSQTNKVSNFIQNFNKDKILSDKEINLKEFSNGLKFNLENGHLEIYNNDKVILEDNQIDRYLGGYLFLRDNLIYEVVFTEI